jgi:hypothetical protein
MGHATGYCSRCHQKLPPPPTACMGCNKPITQRFGHGQPRHFCSAQCRVAFQNAGMRYVRQMIASGKLSIAALHSFKKPTRTRRPNRSTSKENVT